MSYQFFRQYHDENEREAITEEQAREKLAYAYDDVDAVIDMMKVSSENEGRIASTLASTNAAIYWCEKGE